MLDEIELPEGVVIVTEGVSVEWEELLLMILIVHIIVEQRLIKTRPFETWKDIHFLERNVVDMKTTLASPCFHLLAAGIIAHFETLASYHD